MKKSWKWFLRVVEKAVIWTNFDKLKLQQVLDTGFYFLHSFVAVAFDCCVLAVAVLRVHQCLNASARCVIYMYPLALTSSKLVHALSDCVSICTCCPLRVSILRSTLARSYGWGVMDITITTTTTPSSRVRAFTHPYPTARKQQYRGSALYPSLSSSRRRFIVSRSFRDNILWLPSRRSVFFEISPMP